MSNQVKFYEENIKEIQHEIQEKKRRLRLLSVYRLLSFLSGFLQVFIFFEISIALTILVFILCFSSFIYFIKKYNEVSFELDLLKEKLMLNQNELLGQKWDYSGFDFGEELEEPEHSFSNDLDIYSQQGFFQSINRTTSENSKKILADYLVNPTLDASYLKRRQESVKELSGKIRWNHDFLAYAKTGIEGSEKSNLYRWLNGKNEFEKKKKLRFFSYALPAITIALIGASFFTSISESLILLLVVLNLTIIGFYLRLINKIHLLTGKQYQNFQNYSRLIDLIQSEEFKSEELAELKKTVSGNGNGAEQALSELAGIMKRFDYRLNMILAVFINGIFLWDIHCVFQLEKWKAKYAEILPEWIETIDRFDALISQGIYKFNHPDFKFPEFDENTVINSKELGHPLLNANQRVCNDYQIDAAGSFDIITGANMAGKSTFLRTVGLNLLMAFSGLPVCAKDFKFSYFKIFTSMRTSDSLSKNESYFYAELKRLKDLLEIVKSEEKVFVILDEILKGTNSADKQEGSKMFLKKLVENKVTGIIATHDLELASLEKEFPEQIKNKCFEIEIEKDQIFFDYKLYAGVTQKMNASILMKQMGIV